MSAEHLFSDDPDAPPSEAEVRAAEALRQALETGGSGVTGPGLAAPEAELATALRSAVAPTPLSREAHEALIARALGTAAPAARSRVVAVGLFFACAAAAASVLLVSGAQRRPSDGGSATALLPARSSQDLFVEPFPREGAGSARIDRITAARGRDLRENRYARWGVK